MVQLLYVLLKTSNLFILATNLKFRYSNYVIKRTKIYCNEKGCRDRSMKVKQSISLRFPLHLLF